MLPKICIIRPRTLSSVALVSLLLITLLVTTAGVAAQASPLPQPGDISCQGWERDTVRVRWADTATDETNYRVERKIGSGAWTEIATLPENSGSYDDKGADVSVQNRRYRVRSFRSSDNSFSPYSDVCNNRRIFDPGPFRFFYGLRGTTDDCPQVAGQDVCLADVSSGGNNVFVTLQNNALQGSVDAFKRLGFTRDASGPPGGLDKIPINVVWCDGGGCAGGASLGLSPFLMEMQFNLTTRSGDPIAWLVALHELFHFQQSKYLGLNDPAGDWVVEGQARSIQDKVCIGADRNACQSFDDIATGYAGYVPQVRGYLANPGVPVNQASYSAALFWTYLTEKYGTSAPGDTVEAGMNLMVKFWEESAANPGRDGIAIINSTLAALGHAQRFRDIWKDFAVANYAKDLSGLGVQAKYLYADMAQPGGNYGAVTLNLSRSMNLGEQFVDTDETVRPWSARYYELRPVANVPVIDIKVTQDSSVSVYYTILGIKGTDIVFEQNVEARHLDRTLINNGYDRVVLIVAGLENLANYRVSFNGTQPSLRILSPTTANKARAGSPTAPDKFRVAVEVLAADGTPLAGADTSNFSFRVGAQEVPAGNILTAATVQGQQWFVLRAPAQSSAGQYDLLVRYGAILSATQLLAVDYSPRTDADSMLVIDRSGSMASFSKMDAAKSAARLYVDSWRTGDKIGVVAFNETVDTKLSLTDWTDTPNGGSRQSAFNAIDSLTAQGGTAIGDAVRRGWNELIANGNTSHDWAIVLLSDGLETAGTETFDTVIGDLLQATGKRPVVHAVAVGPDADRPRMQNAANVTGGTYQYVSTPVILSSQNIPITAALQLDMDLRYRVIATKVTGQQQFFTLIGPQADNVPLQDVVPIIVENGAAELVLSLSWSPIEGSIGQVVLTNPSNTPVAPFERDARHIVWRMPSPPGGSWSLEINPVIIPLTGPHQSGDSLSPYLIQASLHSDVTLDVYFTTPPEERTTGVPMPIVASLTDTGPILGAALNALIKTPAGAQLGLTLYDDGAHGDGASNDGIYANTFFQTGESGSYNVALNTSGTSPLSGPFVRQDLASFHIDSTGDRDGDGLPDEWEDRYGTDPDVPDANGDPDNDGLPNSSEWSRGTDPLNPDTDGGGEADGTDPDPLDPSDDGIEPTWVVAYPGNGKVFLKYVLRPAYTTVQLFRADNPAGPFTFLQQATPGSGVMTDTAVTNGTTYCYQAIALDSNNRRSAGLEPSCATPKGDPFPPHGYVLINNGADTTASRNVTLQLWASDTVDPETVPPGDEILLPLADTASGVTEMLISNLPDLSDGVWEPYATQKHWRLAQSSGLATVFAKFRDAAGNESTVVAAAIHVKQEADLAVTKTDSPDPVNAGQNLTYTIQVTNSGPSDASDVTVTDALPGGTTFVSAAPSQGSCTQASGIVTCSLGNLASGASAMVTIVVTPEAGCGIINVANATANEADPNTTNNRAATRTTVVLDDFNRPDGHLGRNWRGQTEGYQIVSDQVVVRAGGPIYWQPATYGADQEACVTLTRIDPRSKQHALMLKVQELNDWRQGAILVSYNARSGNVEVEARDVGNNKWILVGSFTPPTPVVDGDQLRAQALVDGRVEVFINDTSLGTADAGSFYTNKGGQIGLWFRGTQEDDEDDEDSNDDSDRLVQARENDDEEDDDGDGLPAARRALLDDFGGGTIAAPALSCLDIQALAPFPQTFPGPTFALAPLDFTNPIDPAGMPLSIELTDRPEDLDGKPELNVGFSLDTGGYQPLFAEFPSSTFPNGVKDVIVELRHFAGATVLALDNGGAVVSTATQPTQNVRASLSLPGSGIRKLQFNTVETLLYKICWTP